MGAKHYLKDYFSFSRKDRIAAIVLSGLTVVIYLIPRFLAAPHTSIIPDSTLQLAYQKTDQPEGSGKTLDFGEAGDPFHETTSKALFEFDPNSLADAGWTALGLKEKTIRTIRNYLSKGGKFKKPGDLSKIWGLPSGFYDRVKDHIRIAATDQPYQNAFLSSSRLPYEKKSREIQLVDLNVGDSAAFESLPGIGARLASRITGFRDKLGGFYSIEQVGETYGLPDSSFEKIKTYLRISGDVKKININTVTKEELKMHPYFRWKLANAIVEYRNQHGNFTSIDELKKIVLVDEKTFMKIRPYLKL